MDKYIGINNECFKTGTVIDGKYGIIDKLSTGCLCEIFNVLNLKSERIQTIKVIQCKYSSEQFALRLSVETDIINKIYHKYLPKVYDVFYEDGFIIVVMDLCCGISLDKFILEAGPQSEGFVLDIAKKLLEVLDYLHSLNVVLNGLHLQNILLTPVEEIRLIDFGTKKEIISKYYNDRSNVEPTYYDAPEKFIGLVDERTDIYSFGMILYALLIGKDPSAPPYVIHPIRKINPSISYGLEYIINKCMKRNLESRYQDIGEILNDLNNIKKISKRNKKRHIAKLLAKRKQNN